MFSIKIFSVFLAKINHLVVSDCFIVHDPAASKELNLSIGHKLLDLVAQVVSLLLPPLPEEGCFHLYVALFWVVQELRNDGVNDVLDTSILFACVAAIIVLVNCFQPAHVVVRMRHEVDVQHPIFHTSTGLDKTVLICKIFVVVEISNIIYIK